MENAIIQERSRMYIKRLLWEDARPTFMKFDGENLVIIQHQTEFSKNMFLKQFRSNSSAQDILDCCEVDG